MDLRTLRKKMYDKFFVLSYESRRKLNLPLEEEQANIIESREIIKIANIEKKKLKNETLYCIELVKPLINGNSEILMPYIELKLRVKEVDELNDILEEIFKPVERNTAFNIIKDRMKDLFL